MEQERNNKAVIALLVVIIVILAVLCILFATNTISFKSNSVDNNNQSNGNVTDNNNTTEDTSSTINDLKELYKYELGDDLNTEFKIQQIGEIYIATSTPKGKQCNWSDTLIFNSSGEKLKEYNYAYVNIDANNIEINYSDDGRCLSSGENMKTITYQVVNSNIVEK
mgnify:CR=1 FL=1